MIVNGFGICNMLLCVVSLSQPDSRDPDYHLLDILYRKAFVISHYSNFASNVIIIIVIIETI